MAWPFTGFKQTNKQTDRQLDKYILDDNSTEMYPFPTYTFAGFEPRINCSVAGRDDHYATPPGQFLCYDYILSCHRGSSSGIVSAVRNQGGVYVMIKKKLRLFQIFRRKKLAYFLKYNWYM
jgi:hypothetical protein